MKKEKDLKRSEAINIPYVKQMDGDNVLNPIKGRYISAGQGRAARKIAVSQKINMKPGANVSIWQVGRAEFVKLSKRIQRITHTDVGRDENGKRIMAKLPKAKQITHLDYNS